MSGPRNKAGKTIGPKANPKAAIQDWLTLVDPDGAFLTTSELASAFPNGFEPMSPELRTELRARTAELTDDPIDRAATRRWLLQAALKWDEQLREGQQIPATGSVWAAEHRVHLRPDQILLDVDVSNRIRLGVFVWPLGTRLDRRADATVSGDTWSASPVQRAETWCRESDVPLAMVTDDDQWVLVWAPRNAPAASCRWNISDLADEVILQAGFVSLLSARRFFAVSDDEYKGETLERLFERATDAEAEVTKGLGTSVRRSVELLVSAISRDDVATGGRVLVGISATEIYESAVTVLMRLVFLLFAEERRLLPAEDPLWAESYSVLTLRDELRIAATRDGEDALERRSSAWHRLLATFHAVHSGVSHDRLSLPAYGGSLFAADRFPFLEGRRDSEQTKGAGLFVVPVRVGVTPLERPVAIDDRTVLAILDALLNVQVKSGRTKVTQRVSYKALDVEQIGYCYEGLLDHGCAFVDKLSVGLVGPETDEPEIAVADLEAQLLRGATELCEWLAEKTRCNRTTTALLQFLSLRPSGVDLARLRVACGHDDATVERVLPFWGLIRPDLRGLPVVLLPGSQFVTQTATRRNMGAQYTTKTLAEEVVRYAIEPLVFEPGPLNEPDPAKWKIRVPSEILDLRVCDPAVGSGAILTAAGRYLADRLVESVVEHGSGAGRFASRLADLAQAGSDEQVLIARREIVDHCLYGVDKNPVAAEMAKLSLWLITMTRERPFTFLDHAIQVGDSLLGITDIEQLRWLHLNPEKRHGARGFEGAAIDQHLEEATELAERLQDLSVVSLRDAANKQKLHEDLRAKLAGLSVVADSIVGAALSSVARGASSFELRMRTQSERIRTALDDDRPDIERVAALSVLSEVAGEWLQTDIPDDLTSPRERHCFHWPLRFPEVFLEEGRSGFDAIVGNPPFLGGKRISGANGFAYREYLVSAIAKGVTGNADLVAYFFLRSCEIGHSIGLLATNTISQADTREVGLDRLLEAGWTIHRAVKTAPWPNEAGVEIAKLWLWGGDWTGIRILDGEVSSKITSLLEDERRVRGTPERLIEASGKSFQGCVLATKGFILDDDEGKYFLESDVINSDVVKPYLNGADLNDDPQQGAARWVVDFADWPLEKAERYSEPFGLVEDRVKSKVLDKRGYPGWAERWWQFWNLRPGMREAIRDFDRVLAITRVSKTVVPAFIPTGLVPSEQVVVFGYEDDGHFGILTSSFHWWWAHTWCSTMRSAGLRYSLTDAFETFPQPDKQFGPMWERISEAGHGLNQYRAELMVRTELGLTNTYNKVHDVNENNLAIGHLRELHVILDCAVRDAYGWEDIVLDHQHWETPHGMRFTVCPRAKDELLDRLLEFNLERYASEVAAGLHGKKAGSSTAKRPAKDANIFQGRFL
jgi:hypothetical protein